jgi:hypothetical protein
LSGEIKRKIRDYEKTDKPGPVSVIAGQESPKNTRVNRSVHKK